MELAMEKIMSIWQEGTVKEYGDEFQFLFNQVKNYEEMSEYYAIYLFMNGLKPEIRDVFITWHQYSCIEVEDVISLALKIDFNDLQDSFSPFDPNSSFYNKDLEFDIDITLKELMKDNEWFRNGKIQETCDDIVQETNVDEVIDNDILEENGYDNKAAFKVLDEIPEDIMNATRSDLKESVNENGNDVIVSENEIKTIAINEKIVIMDEDSKKNTTDVETNKEKRLECLDVLDEQVSLVDGGDIKRIDQEIIEKESVHVILPSVIGMIQEKVNDVGSVLIKDRKEWQFSINLIVVESFEWKPGGKLCLVEHLKKIQHHVEYIVQKDKRVLDNMYLRCNVMNSIVLGTFGKAQLLQYVTTYDQLVMWIAKSLVKKGFEKYILNKPSDKHKKINVLVPRLVIDQIVGILVLVARKLEGNSDHSAQHRLESPTNEEYIFLKFIHEVETQLQQLRGDINNKVKISCNDDSFNQYVRIESEVADQEINKEEHIRALPTSVVNQEKTELRSKIACGMVHLNFWLNHWVICWTDTGWALSAQVISKRSLFLPKKRKQKVRTSLEVIEEIDDLTPKDFSVPTVSQEYGGVSVLIEKDIVIFLNYKDRRVYKQGTDSKDPAPGPLSLDYGGDVHGFYEKSINLVGLTVWVWDPGSRIQIKGTSSICGLLRTKVFEGERLKGEVLYSIIEGIVEQKGAAIANAAAELSAAMAAQLVSAPTDVVSQRLMGQGGLSSGYRAVKFT